MGHRILNCIALMLKISSESMAYPTFSLVQYSLSLLFQFEIRKDLHWLPIQERINYKIIVTVYKCIHRLAPNYLSSILTTKTRDNRLRQKQVCHELNTHSCAKVVGKQAFGPRAPELWNKLPLIIRIIPTLQSFKQTLKTHLFQSAYRLL